MARPPVRIRDTDKGYKALLERVFAMGRPKITVGIHESEGTQEHAGSGATIADVATWNEFGAGNTPERSFLRAWFDEDRERIKEAIRRLLEQVVAGKITEDVALERLGQWMQAQIQARIAKGISPPNAPSTIAAKGSSTPLIDEGIMRGAITYKVKR